MPVLRPSLLLFEFEGRLRLWMTRVQIFSLEQLLNGEPQSMSELQAVSSQLERQLFICLQQYRPIPQSEFDSQPFT